MIPQKVQALFDFIDFLESNQKVYVEKYVPLSAEIDALDNERWKLQPTKNYRDKEKYNQLNTQIIEKAQPIIENVYTPIFNKLRELDIWAGDATYASIWNNNAASVYELTQNFESNDVSSIKAYKQKYINFREEINSDFTRLNIIFSDLDEVLKPLFEFFKDSNINEFDSFENKSIKTNSFEEIARSFIESKGKNTRFSIPQESFFYQDNLQTTAYTTALNTKPSTMPEVFISYSWDSDKHKEDVLAFADHLRQKGYNTEIDRTLSQQQTATDFTKMMHQAMQNHNKVIVVLSKGYKIKAEGFIGGAGKEYQLLLNDIDTNPKKYILVCLEKRSDDLTPFGLKGRDIVDVTTSDGMIALDYKLQDIDQISLSPVATTKPVLNPQKPKAFTVAPQIDCSIEIVKMNVQQTASGAFGGVYNSIDYIISFDYKNISSNTVNGFDYEVRFNRYLDANVVNTHQDGKNTLIQDSITKPTYKGQTKTTPGFPIKVASHNISQVINTNIEIKIYTDDGETAMSFKVEDDIKVDPDRLGAYFDKTDLRTAFNISKA